MEKYPDFWGYPNFLITQCRIGGTERKPPRPKNRSICPVVSIHWLVTDRRTDRRMDDSIYAANIALRGKNGYN